MPRKSSEAVAAAWYLAEKKYGKDARPKPPAWIGKDAQQTFKDIVGSRAPDLYGPGNLELLAHYCFVHHQGMRLWQMAQAAGAEEAQRLEAHALKFVALAAQLAGKLALLPRHQHGHRSGILNEKTSPDHPWPDFTNEIPY